jgi:hypothetical protein
MARQLRWTWRRRPPVHLPSSRPSLPSLDILLQIAMQERNNQLAHFDALDTKAGIILAFDGVLIALSGNVKLLFELAAIVLASASATTALWSFWPRKFPVLEPMVFRQFLTHEAESTRLKLHDTIASTVMRGGQALSIKIRYLRLALLLLLIAALSFGAGIITDTIKQNTGGTHHVIQKATREPTPGSTRPGTTSPSSTP